MVCLYNVNILSNVIKNFLHKLIYEKGRHISSAPFEIFYSYYYFVTISADSVMPSSERISDTSESAKILSNST